MRVRWIANGSGFRVPRGVAPANRGRPNATVFCPSDELTLEDLAARGQRKRIRRDEVFWHVVPRQPCSVKMRKQLVGFNGLVFVQDHGETDLLAEALIGDWEGGAARDRGMPH